ncbi:aspartate/glutamate racemase family protein [Daeguia caeni]|uniref:Aspartate/glutamate racemase family protein n=1 Tax=Daeguia caeni TaxID=439612 RepID=A0ABV9H7D2_9HYPH
MDKSPERPCPEWLLDDEFGTRARLGLIIPSSGWTPEHEWPRMMPRGVAYHIARMPLGNVTMAELKQMGRHALTAAQMLATARVDVIGYGCTSQTFIEGMDYDRALARNLQQETGIEVVTMIEAVLEALNRLGARKLAMVTPYTSDIAQREIDFMQSLGFQVLTEQSLHIADTIEIAKVPPHQIIALGLETMHKVPDADVLFLSCGNLRTLEAIPQLEAALMKPVISSNQALVESLLARVGIR